MDWPISRRRLLALFLATPLMPRWAGAAPSERPTRGYEADVGILFNMLNFSLKGRIEQEIDRAAGRYRYTMTGQGTGVSMRTQGGGIIRDGRFKPTDVQSVHTVRGRDNKTSLSYDYDRGVIEYHSTSYTFLLGRRRQADDVLKLPPGQQVDDLFSAELNFAADKLDRDPDGATRVTVVRRARPANEGPDDVSPDGYRAEFATLKFYTSPESSSGRLMAKVDLTGFSSWAKPSQPARVAFTPDRHIESVESSMMLGTTFTLKLGAQA